jgi:lipase chaperone LimK
MTRSMEPFDSKLTLGAALAVALLTVSAVWYWQQSVSAPDAAPAAPRARAWDGPVGPGLASGVPADLPALGAPLQAPRDPGLATDAGGHLVPGQALRKLFDSWLARTQGLERQARAAQLRSWLRQNLAAPAAGEADRFVTQYLAYIETEDQLLARERFGAPAAALAERDVEHLLAWQEQRAQRRQRVFGPAVARAWFEDDDSRCGSALREWQKQHVAPAAGQDLDPVELRERRIHGVALEQRRDLDAQACAVQMSQGFAAGG